SNWRLICFPSASIQAPCCCRLAVPALQFPFSRTSACPFPRKWLRNTTRTRPGPGRFPHRPGDEGQRPGPRPPIGERSGPLEQGGGPRACRVDETTPGRKRTAVDSPGVATSLRNAKRRVPLTSTRRLYVELRGIEPLTFSMRTRRATNCATAPEGASPLRKLHELSKAAEPMEQGGPYSPTA